MKIRFVTSCIMLAVLTIAAAFAAYGAGVEKEKPTALETRVMRLEMRLFAVEKQLGIGPKTPPTKITLPKTPKPVAPKVPAKPVIKK